MLTDLTQNERTFLLELARRHIEGPDDDVTAQDVQDVTGQSDPEGVDAVAGLLFNDLIRTREDIDDSEHLKTAMYTSGPLDLTPMGLHVADELWGT